MIRCLLLLLIISPLAIAQTAVHPQAHAHNDYAHTRPLHDALANGFTSIEADIHLYKGSLRVAHDATNLDTTHSLTDLYLRPLDKLVKQNGGYVYADNSLTVTLLIDIKTDGAETYKVLQKQLQPFAPLLGTAQQHAAIQVVISGNRPIADIIADRDRLVSIDGRPQDLGKGFPVTLMPLISENYTKLVSWDGNGTPPPGDVATLRALAQRVHGEGKKLRLWAIPDQENAWKVLLDAGVDVINTDKLEALNVFLSRAGR